MPKTVISGYCAVVGEVEIQGERLPEGSTAGKKGGRKPGSINKPKVAVQMPDGTVKMMSEAIAAKEKKKQEKASATANSKAGSASASPAPPASKKDRSSNAASFVAATGFDSTRPLTPEPSQPYASTSAAPLSTASAGNGTRVSPIAVDDLEDEEEVRAKKGPTFSFDPSPMKNGKRVYETHEVSPGLTVALSNLRKLAAKGGLPSAQVPSQV